MIHETEIQIKGIDVPIKIEFTDTSYSWEQPDYEIRGITLLLTEAEFLTNEWSGTDREYNAILDAIEGGEINNIALEKIAEEYEKETIKGI